MNNWFVYQDDDCDLSIWLYLEGVKYYLYINRYKSDGFCIRTYTSPTKLGLKRVGRF